MFLNKGVVFSKCFLVLLCIVSPLFVRVNAESNNNTLVKDLESILPRSSLAEDTNKGSMAFNPVIHDQVGTIFKQNNERRDTKEYSTTNTSDENTTDQDSQEKNNSQNSTHQERIRVKNARTDAYGSSNQDVELDNLIDPSTKKETPSTAESDIRNDSETLKSAKSEQNESMQGIDGENVPSKEGNQKLLDSQTLEDPGKDIGLPLVDTGRSEIDENLEKSDGLNLEEESEPMRQFEADNIGLDWAEDKGDQNKPLRQDNRPNRQSKFAKDGLGLAKSDSHDAPCSQLGTLDCLTKFTLNLTDRTIKTWEMKCTYTFVKDDATLSVALKNAPDTKNSFALELSTPKSDYKTERKEDNLVPFCIPNDDTDSICLYFDDSVISQPKLVALHPYFVLGDHLEQTLPLGTLDLCLDEDLKKKPPIHHDFNQHTTHDLKNHGKEHHDWKQSKHHHQFGKLEMASTYEEHKVHKPLVQYWNPSENGGEHFDHHHSHDDDTQFSSSHQSNVYHHGNAPLFTYDNHGNAPLFTPGNQGNGYDSNLHSNVAQTYPGYYNGDNAFDKHYRGNAASYSSGNHGNNKIDYDSGNQGNHQYSNSPLYSPGYRNVNAYDSHHHSNAEHSRNYDNDIKEMSDNGWEPIISRL
uniref:Uncharacterized protein n=2 Tax=Cacopsylla melanoneura TaxID=428564 RepID=A0A8D8M3A1_9HEMI